MSGSDIQSESLNKPFFVSERKKIGFEKIDPLRDYRKRKCENPVKILTETSVQLLEWGKARQKTFLLAKQSYVTRLLKAMTTDMTVLFPCAFCETNFLHNWRNEK